MKLNKSIKRDLIDQFITDIQTVMESLDANINFTPAIQSEIIETKSDTNDFIANAISDSDLEFRPNGKYSILLTKAVIKQLKKQK